MNTSSAQASPGGQLADLRKGLTCSAKARRTQEQPISYLVATALANPALVNFAAGLVDAGTLPVEETAAAARAILSDPDRARRALQYDTTLGLSDLRHAVLKHLEALEGKPAGAMGLGPQDVLVTTGSQQALYLIAEVLLDPGDIVIAGNPSYFVYTGTLASFGATLVGVPMDEGGMDVDALERLLTEMEADGRLDRLKLIYCTSYYQNPTGLSLAAGRRGRMVELARRFSKRHRLLILEDAAYRELRYDGDALPSIKSFDPENQYTILTQTFSKPFAPGIKTGYTVMPEDLLHHLLQQKGNHDFGSPNLCMQIAFEALRSGSYHAHVEVLQQAYRLKRNATVGALQTYMPRDAGIHWTRPNGGLYVWLTLPEHFDTSRDGPMFSRAVEAGVLYVPGDYCFQGDESGHKPLNHIRLSFGQVTPEQIEPGIRKLAGVVSDLLAGSLVRSAVNAPQHAAAAPATTGR
jgi:2-aminoadipate transaminase